MELRQWSTQLLSKSSNSTDETTDIIDQLNKYEQIQSHQFYHLLQSSGFTSVIVHGERSPIARLPAARCTPDLSELQCSDCLDSVIGDLPNYCGGKIGGRVVVPSCNVRYEVYRFYDPSASPPSAPPPPPTPNTTSNSAEPPSNVGGSSNTDRAVIMAVVAIGAVFLLAAISVFCIIYRRRKAKLAYANIESMDEIRTAETLQYDFATIRDSTDNFSEENKLGQGGFGPVYKAWRNWRGGTVASIIDPSLINDPRTGILRCIHIGLLCVQENAAKRPTMTSVLLMLNSFSVSLPVPSQPALYMHSNMETGSSYLAMDDSRGTGSYESRSKP
ncbi:hypothetical protein SAY87_008805 [Trapa incisa]|uniref:Gnk2-homologous domain-containing protein n=1 Tax=Trapa incisa TaxID=236973 RepID=A0AAN7K0R1_9MYRT|nr:hypothetical protein SAY87_008805 [Trapa incisa]